MLQRDNFQSGNVEIGHFVYQNEIYYLGVTGKLADVAFVLFWNVFWEKPKFTPQLGHSLNE